MIRKIGIAMVGFAALVSFVAGFLVMVYKEELVQWRATPPMWIWYSILGLFLLGTVGFVMGMLGE